MKRVYLSCPLEVKEDKFNQIVQSVQTQLQDIENEFDIDIDLKYHHRGSSYNEAAVPSYIRGADVFLLVLNKIDFRQPIASMSSGIRKEFSIARSNGIPIYLVYVTRPGVGDSRVGIYETHIDNVSIEGIPSTSSDWYERSPLAPDDPCRKVIPDPSWLFDIEEQTSNIKVVKIHIQKDKRLLLFLK